MQCKVTQPSYQQCWRGRVALDRSVEQAEKRLPHPRKAAGAQITQSQYEEVVTRNIQAELYEFCYENVLNVNRFARIY